MAQSGLKKIFSSRIFLFALLLILVWFGIKAVKMVSQKQELEREIDNLKGEIQKLDKSSREFSQMMEYLKDPNYLEKEAKEKLNLKKEGENVVLVPEANIAGAVTDSLGNQIKNENILPKPESNPVKWWKFFFER